MRWAQAAVSRDQLVLFTTKLDDIIKPDDPVRAVDRVLGQVDWQPMEAIYNGRLGQPPIHPRILCGVILYGLISRIRASRKLEEALIVRTDFRWLAHGMSIDHTTISEFRRKHPQQLRELFVQIVLIGQKMGLVKFKRLGFDGTRVRSNNRKTGTRTPEQLKKAKEELAEQFDRLTAKADREDEQDEESFGNDNSSPASESLSDQQRLEELRRMQGKVDAALDELEKIQQSTETTPKRLPITDPQSRLSKTKEGSFAPSYTPTATVDIDSGMIVDEAVIAQSNEASELIGTIKQVSEDYRLDGPVDEVLADALMATGENLAACEELGVDLYSPVPGAHTQENPAAREDLSEPVPASQIDSLPTKTIKKETRFGKQAFVYDAQANVYWCPAGKTLVHSSSYQTTQAGKSIHRERFRSSAEKCSGCRFASKCLRGQAKYRQIDRGEHDDAIDRQVDKMKQAESSEKYSARRHAGERPFAVIKQVFGVRQFLTRGLETVSQEWRWASIAFNLLHLIAAPLCVNEPP